MPLPHLTVLAPDGVPVTVVEQPDAITANAASKAAAHKFIINRFIGSFSFNSESNNKRGAGFSPFRKQKSRMI